MKLFALAIALTMLADGCPQPSPPPSPVDAAPAPPPPAPSPAPPVPTPPPGPESTCQPACDAMVRVCGSVVRANCAVVLYDVQQAGLIRKPDGGSLTCAGIAAATSKADMRGAGAVCP